MAHSIHNLQTFSVNRKPFAVPTYLSVVRSEGFACFGDAILTFPTGVAQRKADAATHEEDEAEAAADGTASVEGVSSGAAAVAAAGGSTEGALLVRKYEGLTKRRRALANVSRMLALQQLIPDHVASILPVVDAYVASSKRSDVYVVTPHYETTLAAILLSSTVLSAEQILFIVHAVAEAVQALHALGVVVGEIRPEAIFVRPEQLGSPGSVRFMDFTCCHLPDERVDTELRHLDPTVTAASSAAATPCDGENDGALLPDETVQSPSPCYRSPEWALALTDTVGYPSDMWAIGALFLELLIRRPLWRSVAHTPAEYVRCVSQVLGYPANDSYITNPTSKQLWQETSASWAPVGLASLLGSRHDEASVRSVFLVVKKLLVLEPEHRMSVDALLHHPLMAACGFAAASAGSGAGSVGLPGSPVFGTSAGGGGGGGRLQHGGGSSGSPHHSQAPATAAALNKSGGVHDNNLTSAAAHVSDKSIATNTSNSSPSLWAYHPTDVSALVEGLYRHVRVL